MENLEKQLKKIFKKLHRTQQQADLKWLSETRLNLQKHMRENPVQKSAPVRSRIGLLSAKPIVALSATLIFLLAGGNTAMAAWSAIPGDILYPIKLASENITIVLSRDVESKAELHMKYADKRLEELEQMGADTDSDVAYNTDSAALDRVVENMESHMNKIGEYLETPSEPRNIAEVALAVAEFTQAQTESIKRIETQSNEIILPILPAIRQINDEQIQKVTQTLYVVREILEENSAKYIVSDEDEAIKQIVIKRINLLEGGESEVVNVAVPVVDHKDEQVLESGVSSDAQTSKDLSDHSNTTSADASKPQEVESSYQDDTPKIQEDTGEEVMEPMTDDTVNSSDPPAESNTESVESALVENDEPDDSVETSDDTVPEEETTSQENADNQSNEPNLETVSNNTSTGVLQTSTTSQTAAALPVGM